MPYATQPGLIQRYGEQMLVALTDRADTPTARSTPTWCPRPGRGRRADRRLSGGPLQPALAATPPLLVPLAEVIAIYSLHITEPEAKVKADYEAAIKRLAEISKGTIQLKDAAGIEPPAPGTAGCRSPTATATSRQTA